MEYILAYNTAQAKTVCDVLLTKLQGNGDKAQVMDRSEVNAYLKQNATAYTTANAQPCVWEFTTATDAQVDVSGPTVSAVTEHIWTTIWVCALNVLGAAKEKYKSLLFTSSSATPRTSNVHNMQVVLGYTSNADDVALMTNEWLTNLATCAWEFYTEKSFAPQGGAALQSAWPDEFFETSVPKPTASITGTANKVLVNLVDTACTIAKTPAVELTYTTISTTPLRGSIGPIPVPPVEPAGWRFPATVGKGMSVMVLVQAKSSAGATLALYAGNLLKPVATQVLTSTLAVYSLTFKSVANYESLVLGLTTPAVGATFTITGLVILCAVEPMELNTMLLSYNRFSSTVQPAVNKLSNARIATAKAATNATSSYQATQASLLDQVAGSALKMPQLPAALGVLSLPTSSLANPEAMTTGAGFGSMLAAISGSVGLIAVTSVAADTFKKARENAKKQLQTEANMATVSKKQQMTTATSGLAAAYEKAAATAKDAEEWAAEQAKKGTEFITNTIKSINEGINSLAKAAAEEAEAKKKALSETMNNYLFEPVNKVSDSTSTWLANTAVAKTVADAEVKAENKIKAAAAAQARRDNAVLSTNRTIRKY